MNIYEIAKCAGVSPATVSRVLNGTAPVKAETRLRVLQVVQEQHYIPNLAAKNLSSQNVSNNIGLFVPDMDNPFFGAITKCVTQIADRYRYNVFLFNTDEMPEREHRFLETVKEQNLKGIIMIPLSGEDKETERYPVRSEKKKRKIEKRTVFMLFCGNKIALHRRTNSGLLAGMWEFPNTEGHLTKQQADAFLARTDLGVLSCEPCGKTKHIFSHIEWHMLGYQVKCQTESPQFEWKTVEEILHSYALPSAFRFYRKQLEESPVI